MSLEVCTKKKFNSIKGFLTVKISTLRNSQEIPKHDPQSIFIFEIELKEMCIASFKGGYIWCTHPLFCRNSSLYFVHIQPLHISFQQTFKYRYPDECDALKGVGEGQTLHLAPRWMRPKLFCTTKKERFIHWGSENGGDVQYPGTWIVMATQ